MFVRFTIIGSAAPGPVFLNLHLLAHIAPTDRGSRLTMASGAVYMVSAPFVSVERLLRHFARYADIDDFPPVPAEVHTGALSAEERDDLNGLADHLRSGDAAHGR